LVIFTKTELHIASNRANNIFFDFFFKYATYLGDGAMIALLFIALLFVKYRYAFAFLTGSLLTSLVVNVMKKVIFHEMYRPSKYFELFETYKLHLIDGVKLHQLQSFPSGHSATAFNLFFTFAIIVKNNTLKFIFLMLAYLVAYSRIYLSQHFLIDITVGSFIGVIFIFFSFIWFSNKKSSWLNRSVLKQK
jgi:membrane-associated phospholipid phosphatase